MQTKIIIGMPDELKNKRQDRILEALKMKKGTFEEQLKHVIYELTNGGEAYFLKPGKESKWLKRPNPHDMLPCIDGIQDKYSFSDIWEKLCKLRNTISLDSYKKFSVILYRLAYLLDCNYINGKVRFCPDEIISETLESIQKEVNDSSLNINLYSLIYAIDLLGWNEDVKYHGPKAVPTNEGYFKSIGWSFNKLTKRLGRLNTILACISVPISFQVFIDNIISNANNPSNINFKSGLKITQLFANSRGLYTLTNEELVEFHSPYLID